MVGIKHSESYIQSLANETCDGDHALLADKVNRSFTSASSDLKLLVATDLPPAQGQLPAHFTITVEQTEKRIISLKVNKANGPDGLPNWLLRDFAGVPVGHVCAIFNSFLTEAYIREVWRQADVVTLQNVLPSKSLEKKSLAHITDTSGE